MQDRDLVRGLGLTRAAAGGLLLVAPARAAGWVGPVARQTGAQVLTRALGIRDLLLGVRTMRAAGSGAPLRTLLRYGVAADAVDLTATLLAWRHLPRSGRLAVAALATASVALGGRLSSTVD